MRLSQKGIDLIKAKEGLSLTAYRCPAGVCTIGYGHTGKDIFEDMVVNEVEANRLLIKDIETVENFISSRIMKPVTTNQWDALVCLVFNIGITAFKNSTLLQKLNSGDYEGAGKEILRWNKIGPMVSPGLANRRQEEYNLFNKES